MIWLNIKNDSMSRKISKERTGACQGLGRNDDVFQSKTLISLIFQNTMHFVNKWLEKRGRKIHEI